MSPEDVSPEDFFMDLPPSFLYYRSASQPIFSVWFLGSIIRIMANLKSILPLCLVPAWTAFAFSLGMHIFSVAADFKMMSPVGRDVLIISMWILFLPGLLVLMGVRKNTDGRPFRWHVNK